MGHGAWAAAEYVPPENMPSSSLQFCFAEGVRQASRGKDENSSEIGKRGDAANAAGKIETYSKDASLDLLRLVLLQQTGVVQDDTLDVAGRSGRKRTELAAVAVASLKGCASNGMDGMRG